MTHRSPTAMMPLGQDAGSAEIVWRPNAAYLERSRLRRFMTREGIASFEELLSRAADDVAWFWDATVKDLDLQFYRPTSGGGPVTRRAVGDMVPRRAVQLRPQRARQACERRERRRRRR